MDTPLLFHKIPDKRINYYIATRKSKNQLKSLSERNKKIFLIQENNFTIYSSNHPGHRRFIHMGHHMVAPKTTHIRTMQTTRYLLPEHCCWGIKKN